MSKISAFNTTIVRLLDFLYDILDDDYDRRKLKGYKTAFDMFKNMNARAIPENFLYYAAPHAQEIVNKDEHYILSKDINSFEFLSGEDDSLKDGLRLREVWATLPEDKKNTVWHYLNNLLKLSMDITGITSKSRV